MTTVFTAPMALGLIADLVQVFEHQLLARVGDVEGVESQHGPGAQQFADVGGFLADNAQVDGAVEVAHSVGVASASCIGGVSDGMTPSPIRPTRYDCVVVLMSAPVRGDFHVRIVLNVI